MSLFNDDEPLQSVNEDLAGPGLAVNQFKVGQVQVKIERQEDVTNEATTLPVLVELTGAGNGKERMGADIVAVVDVSGSMDEKKKLDKLKRAMVFLIRKLGPDDRLSVVKFSSKAERVCKLRQMTTAAKGEIEAQVQGLKTISNTNITAGLQLGLKVLADRSTSEGRAKAIMLMSDGHQNEGGKAETVALGDVPVHTFGFGSGNDYNPMTLEAIAKNNTNGTFSYAEVTDSETSNLSTVFAQCLGGLLSTVVEDLKVTLLPSMDTANGMATKSTIDKVSAGDYLQTPNPADGSVTVSFGNLYQQEVRKIVVELSLPAITTTRPVDTRIIGVRRSYKFGGRLFDIRPSVATVRRTPTPVSKLSEPLQAEITRIETLDIIKEAIKAAEGGKYEEATRLLTDAQGNLDDFESDEPNSVIETLKKEVDQLLQYTQNKEVYEAKGRPFALCSRTSHDRQRCATRGDDAKNINSFNTPRMDAFVDQAEKFEKDPEAAPVPSVEEDEQMEAAADPLGNIAPSLVQYLEDAIEALNNIKLLVTQSRG